MLVLAFVCWMVLCIGLYLAGAFTYQDLKWHENDQHKECRAIVSTLACVALFLVLVFVASAASV